MSLDMRLVFKNLCMTIIVVPNSKKITDRINIHSQKNPEVDKFMKVIQIKPSDAKVTYIDNVVNKYKDFIASQQPYSNMRSANMDNQQLYDMKLDPANMILGFDLYNKKYAIQVAYYKCDVDYGCNVILGDNSTFHGIENNIPRGENVNQLSDIFNPIIDFILK
jgi:hypothetical protein